MQWSLSIRDRLMTGNLSLQLTHEVEPLLQGTSKASSSTRDRLEYAIGPLAIIQWSLSTRDPGRLINCMGTSIQERFTVIIIVKPALMTT